MRTGAELMAATKPYASENRARSWFHVVETLAAIALLVVVILNSHWTIQLPAALICGLVHVRLFILFHDYAHGAILFRSKPGAVVMQVVGFYMLAVRSVWKETHNYHHKNNAKIIGSAIGSFPVVTVGMYRALPAKRRMLYKAIRHPLTIFFGYLPVFFIGMCIAPFKRQPKKHWVAPLALSAHLGVFALLWLFTSLGTALCLWVVPMAVAHGAGSYLFYAQHNFPDVQLKGRRNWDYTFAALRSSSYFEMPRFMHWFTGNIGYHHVHHLNHRIPFYRLPDAMAAIPELQTPGRTSWRPRDVKACLRLAAWDPDQGRMLTYDELEQAA